MYLIPFFSVGTPTKEIVSIVQTIAEQAKERSIDIDILQPILEGHSLNHEAAIAQQ